MCNFNVLLKTENGNNDNLRAFLNCVTAISFNSNGDGDGIYFNSGKLVKSKRKVNLIRFKNSIKRSSVIISHQRLATHGLTEKYIQPFNSRRFIFAHNGVMGEFSNGKYSDSYGFFKRFLRQFKKEQNMVKSIKNLLDNKAVGSYSIFIYDKLKNELYYFKNRSTFIEFYRDTDRKYLFATTNSNNSQFLNMFFKEKFKEIEIKEGIIYRIKMVQDKILIRNIGLIELPNYTIQSNLNYIEENSLRDSGEWNNLKNVTIKKEYPSVYNYENTTQKYEEELKNIKNELRVTTYGKKIHKCKYCTFKDTNNFSQILGAEICNRCLRLYGHEFIEEHCNIDPKVKDFNKEKVINYI